MPLLKAVILSSLWAFGLGQLEQPKMSVSRAKDKSAQISCKAFLQNFGGIDIHWYREKPNQGLEHLIYVRTNYNQRRLGGKNKKIEKNGAILITQLVLCMTMKKDNAAFLEFQMKTDIATSEYIK